MSWICITDTTLGHSKLPESNDYMAEGEDSKRNTQDMDTDSETEDEVNELLRKMHENHDVWGR